MTLVLAIVAGLVVAGALLILYVHRRLKRLAESPTTARLVESFDDGLAIPMRDCDTRRKERA